MEAFAGQQMKHNCRRSASLALHQELGQWAVILHSLLEMDFRSSIGFACFESTVTRSLDSPFSPHSPAQWPFGSGYEVETYQPPDMRQSVPCSSTQGDHIALGS